MSKVITINLSGDKDKAVDVTDIFKEMIKQICIGDLSYDELEALGIEDILRDDNDPAGIVYKIVVSSWEGEGGL